MTNLSGSAGGSPVEPSIDDHAAADARAQRHVEDVLEAAARAKAILAIAGGGRVVLQQRRPAEGIAH